MAEGGVPEGRGDIFDERRRLERQFRILELQELEPRTADEDAELQRLWAEAHAEEDDEH